MRLVTVVTLFQELRTFVFPTPALPFVIRKPFWLSFAAENAKIVFMYENSIIGRKHEGSTVRITIYNYLKIAGWNRPSD
jgi:hypothetical protein